MSDQIDKKNEQVPNSPDIAKEAESLVVDVKTKEDLSKLADDILDLELKKVFDKIDGEKDIDDGQDKLFLEVQDLVHDKDYVDAAAKVLGWLSVIFFKPGEKPGLEKYENLDDDIDFASLDDNKLQDYIDDISSKIDATRNYNKKLKYTYLLSLAKDYIYKKDKKIELDPVAPRQCMQKELQSGNILLLNKGPKITGDDSSMANKIATVGLQDATDSIWVHSVIISKIENGIPYIINSTGDIGADGKGGAAIAGLTGGLNNKIGIKKEDDAKVNCVEILAETMAKVYDGFEPTAMIKTPKDFLLQKNLKPVYLSTIESKNI